jgi:hypothetical protein
LIDPEAARNKWHNWAANGLLMLSARAKELKPAEMEKMLVFKSPAHRLQIDKAEKSFDKETEPRQKLKLKHAMLAQILNHILSLWRLAVCG